MNEDKKTTTLGTQTTFCKHKRPPTRGKHAPGRQLTRSPSWEAVASGATSGTPPTEKMHPLSCPLRSQLRRCRRQVGMRVRPPRSLPESDSDLGNESTRECARVRIMKPWVHNSDWPFRPSTPPEKCPECHHPWAPLSGGCQVGIRQPADRDGTTQEGV